MSTSRCNRIGPVSMPASTQKIVTPVAGSPIRTAQLMALRPRCRGSSAGWYWIVPSGRAGDDDALHLARAFDDHQLPRVAVMALQRVVHHVALRAEHLHRVARNLHADLRRVRLGDREVRGVLAVIQPLVDAPRALVHEQ